MVKNRNRKSCQIHSTNYLKKNEALPNWYTTLITWKIDIKYLLKVHQVIQYISRD